MYIVLSVEFWARRGVFMRKMFVLLIVCSMLCLSMSGIVALNLKDEATSLTIKNNSQNNFTENNLVESFSKYLPQQQEKKDIQLPWITSNTGLLEWWVRIEYNGETFQQQVPISVLDFREKFLKHPEYGEILFFDVDSDGNNDLEVLVGFYWSIIRDDQGNDIKSLEKRTRVRQLETGGYLDDPDGDLQVWSELHVNYGLFKRSVSKESTEALTCETEPFFDIRLSVLSKVLDRLKLLSGSLCEVFEKLFNQHYHSRTDESIIAATQQDNDYISIGAGYRSKAGEHIPLYTEKRFSFARENFFSPTVFQHQMDPGSAKGKSTFELLYGFQAYKSGSFTPSYDIEFSVEFNPAVYLKTKFIPVGGHVYYYFEDDSQRNQPTAITFAADLNKKARSDEEGIELSLIFDKIDNSLGRTGRFMSFDIENVDFSLLSGKFHYKSSHSFSVGVVVNSPSFMQKVELLSMPTRVDIAWGLTFILSTLPLFYAHATGFIDLEMSDEIGGIYVYYPKSDPSANDEIFIDVPGGIPENTRVEAEVTLNVDLTNLKNPSNYVYGKLKHDCSSNVESIRAFLPEEDIPIVKVSDLPSYSEAKGKLYWNELQGYAYAWRGSSGPPDPVELNLEYSGFQIHNILTIRNGYIDTKFKVADNGYFYFDTSESIFGNDLTVSNSDTSDFLQLGVDEISADELQADWNLDNSGEQLKIQGLSFSGFLDIVKGLQINLGYQGKTIAGSIDWILAETGYFEIEVNQQDDLTIDFSQFAENNSVFDIHGGITLSENLQLDMSWKLKQGEKKNGNVDPGYFKINNNIGEANIKNFDFYMTYQDNYGVNLRFDNLYFYLIFEWWKGDRLLPYLWLEYDLTADDFNLDLLWTNQEGETQWYFDVQGW